MLTAKLFAIWPYDDTFRGGIVREMYSDGRVTTENNGDGYMFTPCKIVPEALGREIMEKLNKIENEYICEKRTITKNYREKISEIMKEI